MLLVVEPPVPVPVGAVYLCVDGAVVVSNGMDPNIPIIGGQSILLSPVVGLWEDRSWRQGGPTTTSPHEVLQLPELVLQLHVAGGQGLHYGGVVGPHVRDRTGVQVIRA